MESKEKSSKTILIRCGDGALNHLHYHHFPDDHVVALAGTVHEGLMVIDSATALMRNIGDFANLKEASKVVITTHEACGRYVASYGEDGFDRHMLVTHVQQLAHDIQDHYGHLEVVGYCLSGCGKTWELGEPVIWLAARTVAV